MHPETIIALKNYDALIRDKGLDDVELDWASGTIAYGDGGSAIEVLAEAGFSQATVVE